MIYFLVVNYYSSGLIQRLLQSLSLVTVEYHLVIVNNSVDEDLRYFEQYNCISIIAAKSNLGFAKACNLGLNWIYSQNSNGIVWLINPDAYLQPKTLKNLDGVLASLTDISILGTIIYTQELQVWFAGGYFFPRWGAIYTSTNCFETDYHSCDWVSGCSLILNLAKFSQCPQFNEAYFLYYEDFDFCRRSANLGHQVMITNLLGVIHQPSSITNRNLSDKFKYSTYSYLLTLQEYTSLLVFSARFTRLLINALLLLSLKPSVGKGKFLGIVNYLIINFKFNQKKT